MIVTLPILGEDKKLGTDCLKDHHYKQAEMAI